MTQAVLFTALVPLALLGVLAVVVLSGRLEPGARARLERWISAIFYPAAVLFWVWRLMVYANDAEWLLAACMGIVSVAFAIEGVKAVRRGRLFPYLRGAR